MSWDELGNAEFRVASGSHSSGNLINLAQTNCLAYLPISQKIIQKSDDISVLLVR